MNNSLEQKTMIMKTLKRLETRVRKLEKTVENRWGRGYDAGSQAELNKIITIAESKSDLTLKGFIQHLKKRKNA